jgi:hypothetical protein
MTKSIINQLIAVSRYLITDRDVEAAKFFADKIQKHGTGFDHQGLQHPYMMAFYRMMGALKVWEDQEGIFMGLIAWPTSRKDFCDGNEYPEPEMSAPYLFCQSLASEFRARPRCMPVMNEYIRNRFPNVTHWYGWRANRQTRLIRVRP